MDKFKTTCPIVKLFPLEVSDIYDECIATSLDIIPSGSSEASQSAEEPSTVTEFRGRLLQELAEWTDALRAPEDVEN